MLPSKVRMRVTFTLVSIAGLALPSLGGTVAFAGTAPSAAAAVTWSRVTPAGTNIIDDVGLARGTDGVLHVLWTTDAASNQAIMDTPISAGGTVGTSVQVTKFFLATDPDAVVTPTGLAAVWNGIKTSAGNSP